MSPPPQQPPRAFFRRRTVDRTRLNCIWHADLRVDGGRVHVRSDRVSKILIVVGIVALGSLWWWLTRRTAEGT